MEMMEKDIHIYTPFATTKTTLDYFTNEIIITRKQPVLNQNNGYAHVKGVNAADLEQKNDKVINFSTNIAENSSSNDISLLEYVLGSSNENSSSSKSLLSLYLKIYFAFLFVSFSKRFF